MSEKETPPRSSRAMLVLVGLCVVLGAWIAFSPFMHDSDDADDLIPAFVSLYHWTPFLWGQDRFGMPLAALASPVSHPLHNYQLQLAVTAACSLLTLVLIVRLTVGAPRWPLVAAAAIALFLGLVPIDFQTKLMAVQCPYNTSMCLGTLALLLMIGDPSRGTRPGAVRIVLGGLLMALAHWINLGILVWLALLLAGRMLLTRRDRTLWVSAGIAGGLAGVGFGVGQLIRRAVPQSVDYAQLLPLAQWPESARELAHSAVRLGASWPIYLGASTLLVGGVLLALRRYSPAWRPALLLYGAAAAYGLFLCGLAWTRHYQYHFRYLLPAVVLVTVGNAVLVGLPAARLVPRRFGRLALALLILFAVGRMLWIYGPPSPAGVRNAHELKHLAASDEIVRAGVTHVMGDYWSVTQLVFCANTALHEQGDPRVVWALSGRSASARPAWSRIPRADARIAIPVGETHVGEYLRYLEGQSFTRIERWRTIYVVRP